MDRSISHRRRERRTGSHTSQENLVKDSSSDISPRDSSISTLKDRRLQRRQRQNSTDQQYDNGGFAADEHPLSPPVERNSDDYDEEELEVRQGERLVTQVTKQHRRNINELQEKGKRSNKRQSISDEVEQAQDDINEQLRKQQGIVSKHIADKDDDQVASLDTLPTTIGSVRDKSIDRILQMAAQAKSRRNPDDDLPSTLGSSRHFGTSSELKLQKLLRQTNTKLDTSTISSPVVDRSTRFDFTEKDDRIRGEVERKQRERQERLTKQREQSDVLLPSEQDDFFLKDWPSERPLSPESQRDTDTDRKTTDETEQTTDPSPIQDQKTHEERQPLLPSYGEPLAFQYQRAERLMDEDEERQFEEKLYKYVVAREVTLDKKLGDGVVQTSSLEDEGIYVGKKPIVPVNMVHRAEQRIVQEAEEERKKYELKRIAGALQENEEPKSNDRWFAADGSIIALPDPTKFVPTRPFIDELFDPILGKEFCKAYTIDSETGMSNDPIGVDRYRLDIDIGTISFLHHHLMSIEHVLAMRIRQMYQHYTVRRQQNLVQQLSEKIKALKSAENNCRNSYEQNRYSESGISEELHNRLINYQNELRQTRNQRCNEMRLDRQLLQHLLETWKQIKDIRRTNGYTTTAIRLLMKQISGKKNKHYEQMQKQVEEEIDDEIVLANEQYEREKQAHADIVKKRKLQTIKKKEARKRLEKKQDLEKRGRGDEDDYNEADIAIMNEEEILVPEKPEPRKPDEIRTNILLKYQNAIRPPDEPEILLELVYSEPISTDAECNARERARRHNVQQSSIIARILINGKIIANTQAIPLGNEFETRFSQIFPCYVARTPETIKIEIYETSTRFRSPLAELYIPIPESTLTSENYKLQSYEFSSNVLRQFKPNQTTAVGAGIQTPIQIDRSDKLYLNIEGILSASAAWGVEGDAVLIPPDYGTSKAFRNRQLNGDARQNISMQAINLSNMKHLTEWIQQSNLDPYDPDNAFLLNLMKDHVGNGDDAAFDMNALQHFRLSMDYDEHVPHDKRLDIDNSLRFKLLEARKENLPYFRDFKYVPPYDYLVRKEHSVFKNFMNRRQETSEIDDYEKRIEEKRQTRIDIVRRQGEKQLRKMREQILARFASTSIRKSYQQMVVEEAIPNIQALRGLITKLYIAPARPLYPTRRTTEQKKVTNLSVATNREVFILINLIGALDLPIRHDALTNEKMRLVQPGRGHSNRNILLRPYVEIQFQKNTYRTSTVEGPNPNWNEEIRIPFRPPDNDFDTSSLQRCRDILYINIFDQLDVDIPKTDRDQDKIIHKRIERNWLGSIKIPFSNIYVNGRLEGSYRLSVPNPLLGYVNEKLTQARLDANRTQLNSSVLRMFVTMEPLLAPPETIPQSFDSTESLELLNQARVWVEDLNKKFPNRDYKATVSDINGRAVFIPRFIHPLPLPPLPTELDEPSGTASVEGNNHIICRRLARFVSLIPFLADSITFPGICDIWETSDQFLQTMAGDDEEHAVLLNNYFLTLNKKTWIAMGTSIYSGPCCFVLTKDDADHYPICWSVGDGHPAKTIDIWNPIRNIYLLANAENVWANIQEHDLPSRMDFDVTNTRNWRPFFNRSLLRDKLQWASVQPNDLHYETTRRDDIDTLRKHIYDIVRDKICEWREPYVTRWNWACQKRLEEIIRRKEKKLVNAQEDDQDLEKGLEEFQNKNEITGFPLQMPYTTIQAIVDTVYSTKMFEHPTNDIEFALAVHVFPYPNNVLAVWIYLAHLLRKSS